MAFELRESQTKRLKVGQITCLEVRGVARSFNVGIWRGMLHFRDRLKVAWQTARSSTSQKLYEAEVLRARSPTSQKSYQPELVPTRTPTSQNSYQPDIQPSRHATSQKSYQPKFKPARTPASQNSSSSSCWPPLSRPDHKGGSPTCLWNLFCLNKGARRDAAVGPSLP